MNSQLHFIEIANYSTEKGIHYLKISLSYQLFGKPLHTAPVILVNHALTGNSNVAGSSGWWQGLVGKDKLLNTDGFSVLCFNILGNGYDGNTISNYKDFTARDVAYLFVLALRKLKIEQLHTIIGGSLGGGLVWEMIALAPKYIRNAIAVATDWKATDWVIATNYVQEKILKGSPKPLEDVRMLAMLLYRTPNSLKNKFERKRTKDKSGFAVEAWLEHHGAALKKRFCLPAYLMMNHLLTTLDISRNRPSFEDAIAPVQSNIIQIAVDSDLLFTKEENQKTHSILQKMNKQSQYYELKSIHGHDGFLLEDEQITQQLKSMFAL